MTRTPITVPYFTYTVRYYDGDNGLQTFKYDNPSKAILQAELMVLNSDLKRTVRIVVAAEGREQNYVA